MENFNNMLVGKGVEKLDPQVVKEHFEKNTALGKVAKEGELEKTEDQIRLINGVDTMVSDELQRLGVPKLRNLEKEQVHIMPRNYDTPYLPKGKGGQFNAQKLDIKLRTGEKTTKEEILDFARHLMGNNKVILKNRFGFLKTLLHESIHHAGHLKSYVVKSKEKDYFNPYRSGYKIINRFDKKERIILEGFNEGVVERLTRELIEKNREYIEKNLKISEQEKNNNIQKTHSYDLNVDLIKVLTESLSKKEEVPEQQVWDRFKRGHFTGEMMHLRSIEKLYGKGSLRVLGVFGDKKKKEEIIGYFTTSSPEERKKMYEDMFPLDQKLLVITEAVKQLQSIMFSAANKHLSDNSSLRNYVFKYYENTASFKKELLSFYKNRDLNDVNLKEEIKNVTDMAENKTLFIETMQRSKEREESFRRKEQRIKQNPVASEEEFEAGAYKEELESQISNAVFLLRKKGYSTFESGFRNGRHQYMGMYNKNIVIPESVIEYFKEKSFEISLVEKKDRTTINLLPLKDEPVLLEEWKVVWNDFANKMPDIEKIASPMELPIHSNFRKKQEAIRDGKNVYLGYNTAYVDGKVVSMDDGSFKERYFKK